MCVSCGVWNSYVAVGAQFTFLQTHSVPKKLQKMAVTPSYPLSSARLGGGDCKGFVDFERNI
jgi:hypothetical protein